MSQVVRFSNWRPGLQKIGFTLLLRSHGIGLEQAKLSTEQLMLGQPVLILCSSDDEASQLAKAADELGAIGEVIERQHRDQGQLSGIVLTGSVVKAASTSTPPT